MRDEVDLTAPLDLDVPWYRNADGTTVHRSTCRHAAIPWQYAEGWTLDRVLHFVGTLSYMRLCRQCVPMSEREDTR